MANDRLPILIGLAGAALVFLAGKKSSTGTPSIADKGARSPIWPIAYDKSPHVPTSGGLSVGSKRPAHGDQTRYHAGIDLDAREGAPVVATESGTIVATQGWAGGNAKAILLETDTGVVVNYGAVAPNSWKEFGVHVGKHVPAGHPIARIGVYPKGSTMLHFELYESGTRKASKWMLGDPAPPNLIDPTKYLQKASSRVIA